MYIMICKIYIKKELKEPLNSFNIYIKKELKDPLNSFNIYIIQHPHFLTIQIFYIILTSITFLLYLNIIPFIRFWILITKLFDHSIY